VITHPADFDNSSSPGGPLARVAWLALAAALLTAVAAPLALAIVGSEGPVAVLIAAAACWAAVVLPLLLESAWPGRVSIIVAVVGGMMLRMGVALGFVLWATTLGAEVVSRTVVYFVIVFYLALVATETALQARQLRSRQSAASQQG